MRRLFSKELYCLCCDKIRTFKLDTVLNHSCCVECGARMGVHPNNPVLVHFQNKIAKKKKPNYEAEIKTLQQKCDNQRKIITGLMEKTRILKKEIEGEKNAL